MPKLADFIALLNRSTPNYPNFVAVNEEMKRKWLEQRKQRKEARTPDRLLGDLLEGSRVALSESITLLESQNSADRKQAQALIQMALPHAGKSVRVGITGVPGVGKSTFIESFGQKIIASGKKLAVLAIDPSSEEGGGSILGDKTRMETLSLSDRAFIRPSPSGKSLGGVARATREAIVLCEAAGYDFILVETVGVGQSETLVHSMVDYFLLLMLAGAGDELQGIKRGIMEMADVLLINKADGDNAHKAKLARREYKNAMHLFPPKKSGWIPNAFTVSGLNGVGLDEVIADIDQYVLHTKTNGYFDHLRGEQDVRWYRETIQERILEHYLSSEKAREELAADEKAIRQQQLSPFEASEEWVNKWIKNGI